VAPNDRPSKPLPKDKEKRRRELERLKYERQVARRRESVKRTRRNTAIVGVSVLAVAGIAGGAWAATSGGSKPKKTAAAASTASATASAAASAASAKAGSAHVAGCTTPAAGKPTTQQWKTEPAVTIDTKANYTATISTNCGPITVKLDAAAAPHTVNSFVYLASQHFFDHVTCHRLTTAGIYVLQCGDPTGTGSGGPGYSFKDENLTASSIKGGTYPAGTVAMANSGANTNGSQFFLVYKDSTLAASYTPFGTITGGLSELQKIAAAGTNNANGTGDGAPLQTVVMNALTTAKS
jgi:peptidyl-prolyl cis-trans isomerase B (cyclophilin B)